MNTVTVSANVQAHWGIFTLASVVVGIVNGHMPFQQVLSTKSFCANRANERALPGVAPNVTYEVISASVFRLAEAADIQPRCILSGGHLYCYA